MIVVGGVYHEICRDPSYSDLFGSGARAAYALSNVHSPPKLHSAVNEEAAAIVRAKGIALECIERPQPICFMYDTPVSRPMHDYSGSDNQKVCLNVEADSILTFGMVEARPVVKAVSLVIDPQSPGLEDLEGHFEWSAERLAIVGNHREILGLCESPSRPVAEAAEQVRSKYSAEIVIAKCGPLGAFLVDDSGTSFIEPYPTVEVWPIGSGDVYSALFAWYWAERGEDPLYSAQQASKGTATWCSRGPLQVVTKRGDVVLPKSDVECAWGRDVKIYLAGPFFSYGERWLVDQVRDCLKDLGVEVFSPLHDVGKGEPSKVAPADLRGLEECSAVLALLDGEDPGTLFEVGYAKAKNIPVVGLTERPESTDFTMLIGTDIPIYSSLAQAAYNAVWAGLR